MPSSQTYPQAGDFVVHMESTQYCLLSLKVVNGEAGAATIKQVAGTPVVVDKAAGTATLVAKADIGTTTGAGFLVDGPQIASLAGGATAPNKYSVLWSGPAVLNRAAYNLDEPFGGTDYTAAELNTWAAAIADVRVTDEPAKKTTQTT